MNPQHAAQLTRLHRLELNNRQLAWAMNVSEATIKRWKRTLGLGSTCARNQLGERGEQLFTSEARRRGWPARRVGALRHPYDVQLGDLRVEVKTALPGEYSWRFRLPRWRPSFHGEGSSTPKDYVQDCDVQALVALEQNGSVAFIHFQPPRHGQTNVSIPLQPDPAFARHNWDVLNALTGQRAA